MTAPERDLHVLLPGDVADPSSPSGGNAYGLRVCHDLAAEHGWRVHRHDLAGSWPRPDPTARDRLAGVLAGLPDGAVVLLDGLVACGVPDVVVPEARRLRIAVLVHLPLADETGLDPQVAAGLDALERATLQAAAAVVVTGPAVVLRMGEHGLDPDRVHVATPGVDAAPVAPGTDGSTRLLCVASLTPRKGQDLLVDALAELADRPWTLVCAGPLHRDPGYVQELRERIERRGLGNRVQLPGPLFGDALDAAYAAADLAVLVSWKETYGMAVTEALARGIPVLAGSGPALTDTLGRAPDGSTPGLLVAAGDHAGLVAALRSWFDDPELRYELRRSARERRRILLGWEETARSLHEVLDRLRRTPVGTAQ